MASATATTPNYNIVGKRRVLLWSRNAFRITFEIVRMLEKKQLQPISQSQDTISSTLSDGTSFHSCSGTDAAGTHSGHCTRTFENGFV